MIFPNNFEDKIDFGRIREQLKVNCAGAMGQWLVDQMSFSAKPEAVKRRLLETNEMLQLMNSGQPLPTEDFFDFRDVFAKIRVDGSFIDVPELFNLYKSLIVAKAIVRFLTRDGQDQYYPTLSALAAQVNIHDYVIDNTERIINKHGKVRDNASPELATIRHELALKQNSVSKLIHRIIGEAQQEGWVEPDTQLAVRDGRVVIPIAASYKRRIQGIIHDESATGKTSYVEPAPVVELNNQISELESAERREIIKILKLFTKNIRPYVDDLDDAMMFLGIIDFDRAKARLAQQLGASMPKLVDEPKVDWRNARHPILMMSFAEEGKTVVPLNIELTEHDRILVISGPNAGGKSVCLKTVGTLQYMLQCGLLIPIDPESTVGIFDSIFIDIGDEQSIDNDLSTYSSHLLNMKQFVRLATSKSMILIDEFGAGTEPMLGGVIAETILNRLNQIGVYGVITTHYTNLKHFAASTDGIINGAMLYDTNRMEPMFIMEMGKPGSSFAFEIAYKIGLPQDLIEEARSKVGEEHVNFDKHLRQIARDKYYWERKRENIRKIERRLEEMMEKEKSELDEMKKFRKEVMQKTNEEARRILNESNKMVENTVRQIKEAQAEKEKTREVRQQLEQFKQDVLKPDTEEESRIMRKIAKLRERENKVKGDKKRDQQKDAEQIVLRTSEFTIGMPVKIKGQTTIGEIMELNGKNVLVAFGSMMTSTTIDRIEMLNENDKARLRQSPKQKFSQSIDLNQRRINFNPYLDVRGQRTDDAISMVAALVDEAVMVGASELHILHGKGNGILRQMIRQYLQTLPVIDNVRDEHVEFGGAGITVVELG
ncbi:MAG: Smr/MutS family protein [Salinivirgaceae bacterium]|nr:Smr/MutS family protein [Salinivirgaceae bacterium]